VAVTGASAGIGFETALAFGRSGACVAACARRKDRLDQLFQTLASMGCSALVLEVDVAERDSVKRFVEATVERFGRLDVLVNNAGFGARGGVEETPGDVYERLMSVNYLGTVWGCQLAIPVMKRQGKGVIINVSSIVGHRALPAGGAYAATKSAQISLTESLRVELKGTGVFACSVHPIGTKTEFSDVVERVSPGRGSGAIGPQQSARSVAESIVACARRPRGEVYPYAPSRLLVWLNALAPGIVDRLASRAAKKAGRID